MTAWDDRPATAEPSAAGPAAESSAPVEAGSASAASGVDGPATGDPRVDDAVARLDGVTDRPPAEQVAEYEGVHRALQDILATIDEG